jgi:PAS domain S-box-containing protein
VTLFAALAGGLTRKHVRRIGGVAAMTIAAATLIGWWAGLPLLSSWRAGSGTTKPVTAFCLAAIGLALLHAGKNSRVASAVGVAVMAAGGLDLSQDLFGIDLSFDRWLAPQATVPGPWGTPLHVTNATAVALLLAGSSLVLSGFERYRFAALVLGGVIGAIAVFALLGYLIGVDALYGAASISSPPLPTAAALICIAAGIIAQIGVMPAFRKPRPLWHLLVMLGCAIVAPLLLFGAYAGYRTGETQLRDVRENLMIEARTLSASVDREIIGEMERLQALATSPSLRRDDFAEFRRQAEASLGLRHTLPQPRLKDEVVSDPKEGAIILVDRNMQQLVNTRLPVGTSLPKTGTPSRAIEKALATGEPQVTGLFTALSINQLVVVIIVPVRIDGENRYALERAPDQYAIARVVAATELPAGWQAQAVVSDDAHRIIASSDQAQPVGKELPPAQWRDAESGVFEFVDVDGRRSLEASMRSAFTGWDTAVWAPKALLEAPIRAQWRTLGVTALLAIALVVALALWLGRIIARSVGHAARAAVATGEGRLSLPTETPVVEVNRLMAELRQTTELLRKSKDRMQLALDAAQLGSWQYDPLSRIVTGDARCQEIFDVTTNETAIEAILKPVHPDDAERLVAAIEASLDPGDPERSAAEFRFRRRDGQLRWVEILGLAYFEGVGRERRAANMAGTVRDITERKEREEMEHLLMREINHRAKNMLSVVASIAHQTAARNPDEFVARFAERIQALSANQDLLVRSEWRGVEIADLVRAQLAHFADLISSRIALHGPKARLNPASAQAIGLALHELATNAGKYGALSTDKGRVDIRWRIDGDTLTMSWTERDGPPVSAPKRRGFGTIVMEAMAERSVDGTVDLNYVPSGLTWRLTCPARNALEPWERERLYIDKRSALDKRSA